MPTIKKPDGTTKRVRKKVTPRKKRSPMKTRRQGVT
jgi:hypothetical protein